MRSIVTIGLMLILGAVGSAQDAELSMFAWLAGTWEATQGPRAIEELWTPPTSNAMIGLSRTVAGGRTAEFEFLRIEKRGADLFYVPQPSGRPPVSFKLTSSAGGRYIFENTTGEDRVNKIEYRREGDDGLYARVEGAQDGKPFAFDYHYRRRK